jgi:hypothetical protein
MSVYVGIDVHRKRSQVAVIDQSGEVLANRNVPNGAEPILKVIGGLPPGTPAEIHHDESQQTAAAVLRNAVTWFAQPGVAIEPVPPDNGSCYRSHRWRQTCADLASPRNGPGPAGPRPTQCLCSGG